MTCHLCRIKPSLASGLCPVCESERDDFLARFNTASEIPETMMQFWGVGLIALGVAMMAVLAIRFYVQAGGV